MRACARFTREGERECKGTGVGTGMGVFENKNVDTCVSGVGFGIKI